MQMNNQRKVREFHEAFGMPVADRPGMVTPGRRELRIDLIEEEAYEVGDAMKEEDLAHIAKELADLLYVTYGAAIEYGINLDEVFDEVHRSNMSKLDVDGKPKYRADGKVLKGPN